MAMIFIAIAVSGFVFTLWQSAQQTVSQQTALLSKHCEQLQTDIQQLFPRNEQKQVRVGNPDLLQQQINRVTANLPGVEGGFWHIHTNFFGYAFPTYLGSDIKTDVPNAEKTLLSSLSQRALEQDQLVEAVQRNADSALISVACPITTHEGLSAWLMQRASLVPVHNTVTTGVLFVLLGVLAIIVLAQTIKFERRWYLERDRLVKQGEDESKPVPVTSDINEIQPLLMLLYQARQKNINLERTITALEAKLSRNQELSHIARLSSSLARELVLRVEQWKLSVQQLLSEKQSIDNDQLDVLLEDLQRIENLVVGFENLDTRNPGRDGNETLTLRPWLEQIVTFHQQRTANDGQTLTAICPEPLTLISNSLLVRFALDTLIAHALNFGPNKGEVLIKASGDEHEVVIEVIDEFEGLSSQDERRLFRQDDVLPQHYGNGLKLARDAVQAIGGDVSYQSDGANSRFIMQIPMTSE